MALKSQKTVESSWYTPEDEDEDAANPCRFHIRALSASEQIEVLETFRAGRPTSLTFRRCFAIGVQKIENYLDGNDRPVKLAAQFLALQDTLDLILEVGAAVFEKSYLTDEEKKT